MVNRTVFIAARRVRGHKAFGGRAAACSPIRGQKALWRGFWRGARGARLLITGGIGGKDSDLLPLPDVLYKVPDRFDGWEQFVALFVVTKSCRLKPGCCGGDPR
jgi:hypothetical protein